MAESTAQLPISVATLRARICTIRNLCEELSADAKTLWESAPANSETEVEADLIAEALYDIAGDLGELEGD